MTFLHADVAPHTHGLEASPVVLATAAALAITVGVVAYMLRKKA